MIEGTVERLLLHEMIKREAKSLLNQYLSVIEVGGAYALNFKEFLEFIGGIYGLKGQNLQKRISEVIDLFGWNY